MTARTRTLTPDAMTLPSTRSARKAVLLNKPNGTSTKPASVVSLNSIRVMNSCTARMKKATSTTSQAISSTTIWTKFSKNATKPISWLAACRDLGVEQSEAGIDVGGEDLQEAINDPRDPHRSAPLGTCAWRAAVGLGG